MLPLEGLLVISLEQAVAAPTCTLRLADAGARVIKIERAEGETARHYDKVVHGTSAYFAWLNRGKESAVLDIKAEDDRALLERMIAKADVFVQNLAPGATKRLGLSSAELADRYLRLVAVDIAGYPQDTSYRSMRAYDMLVQAESGVCAVTGTPEKPVKVGVSMADVMTGMNAHAAILEALIERAQTGRGKTIEITMFDSMADMMSVPLLHHEYGGRETPRTGLAHASIYPYGSFACSDGEIVIVVQNPGEWRRLCTGVLARPDLVDDPRFCDNPKRVDNRAALGAILSAIFGGMTRVTMRSLESAGAAAVHIDDQVYPKRAHYHRGLTRLVAVEEMVAKLAAMKAIRRGTGTLLVARTDALRAGASIDDTIARCQSYVQAGAEAVIVLDLKPEQAPALRENLRDIPLFWIGGVDEPVPDTTNLEQVGFAAALYPFMLISATFDAMDNALAVLRETGRPSPGSRSARELAREALDAIGFDALLEIETRTTERGGSA